MGLRKDYLTYIDNTIKSIFGSPNNLHMLELGDQKIKGKGINFGLGKSYYQDQGLYHTSVDLNGRNGAIVKDLKNLDDFIEYHNKFDIVTNSGTTEHVDTLEGQYTSFLNIHKCLKNDGIAIHIVPDIDITNETGRWADHCDYFYSIDLFTTLVENSDYKTISFDIIDNLRAYTYQKNGDKFIDKNLFLEKIHVRKN